MPPLIKVNPTKRELVGLLIPIATFALGVWVGTLKTTSDFSGEGQLLKTHLCLILRHPELIGARRFATKASIVSIQPHGSVLQSPDCPLISASFSESLDRRDHDSELNEIFKRDPYASVPVTFEGQLYRPSLIKKFWYQMMNGLGVQDQTAPIVVHSYNSVGKDERYPQ